MNKNYVDQRIEEALAEAKGNRANATQLLLAWCLQDKLLEDGLFAAFREPVTHAQVQRVAHQLELQRSGKKPAPGGRASIDNTAMGHMLAAWEKNFSGGATVAAEPAAALRSSNSNQSHNSSLQTIADAFKKPFRKKPENLS